MSTRHGPRPFGATILEKRFTVGIEPREFLRDTLGIPALQPAARALGYSSSAISNWQGQGHFPYAVYLAFMDQYGRDEKGRLRKTDFAQFEVVPSHGSLLHPRVEGFAKLEKLPILKAVGLNGHAPQVEGPPAETASAEAQGQPTEAPAPRLGGAPKQYGYGKKGKKGKRPGTTVRTMDATEMAELVRDRVRHHANGNGALVDPDVFGIAMDVPKGFGGARIEFKITPRIAAQ